MKLWRREQKAMERYAEVQMKARDGRSVGPESARRVHDEFDERPRARFPKTECFGMRTRLGRLEEHVATALENDGVDNFKKSWQELLEATQDQLDAAT